MMVRLSHERVLLIGDGDRQVFTALSQALPTAQVRSVSTLFDAIAELSHEQYTTVLAAAEPMERRPEAAVRALRELSGDSRLLLFGDPTLEPLSRKMMEFGCDDYLVTPVAATDLLEMLRASSLRLSGTKPTRPAAAATSEPAPESLWGHIPLTEIVLDAMVKSPQESVEAILKRINSLLPMPMRISTTAADGAAPKAGENIVVISERAAAQANSGNNPGIAPLAVHLIIPTDENRGAAEAFAAELLRHLSSVQILQDRHASLQRLAITDDLTGLANGRYFRHFLVKIIEKARVMRFPVTLFLFDIDNFKRYNDQYGHGVGDEILKQTAALMRHCVRDHDLVARISGDEFAVVFWEKEGPRQPRDPKAPPAAGRTPQETQEILGRFRRLLATQDYPGLGPGGKGSLTISGGIAVCPWDAQDANGLIDAADRHLMFGAKRSGRNSIHLVGGECLPMTPEPPGN
jgi:two-component system, cell cycle response regulator